MPVNYATPAADQLFPVAGVRLGVAEAEIRKKNRRDLTLVALDAGCTVAGVFTQNASALRRYRFAASIWRVARKSVPSSSTPGLPMPVPANRAVRQLRKPVLRSAPCSAWHRNRYCRFRPG